MSGLNQHTANVPNRKVPKVRILLLPHFGSLAQLDQSTTLRTSVSGVESLTSHNIGGLAELVYCTGLENRQTATSQRFESLASANLPYRITVVRQILDLQVVVRFHLGQHQ